MRGIDPQDIAICTALEPGGEHGGAVTPPIYQTSIFAFPKYADLVAALGNENEHFLYARGRNPTVAVLERKLAQLERGEDCKVFASGMGAISAVMMALLQAGDHVLFLNHVYGPTLQFADHLGTFGVESSRLTGRIDADAIGAALRPNTRLIWLESPGTLTFDLVDLGLVSAIARSRGITTVIDNSWATPLFQKPIEHGIDIVVHTCSKYLGGHSDTVAGAVIANRETVEWIFYKAFLLNGAAAGPLDAWLILRGLRTLPVRLAQHERSAAQVMDYLIDHPRVTRLFHPRFSDRPDLAEQQLCGFSGLFSFELKDADYAAVQAFLDALSQFHLAISWGGYESLALAAHRGDAGALQRAGLPEGLIRLSVGLEPVDALIDDLAQALGD